MWSFWSRYWLAFGSVVLRWQCGWTPLVGGANGCLETRIGRDGARWAILTMPGSNVIRVRRRQTVRASTKAAHGAAVDQDNVVRFATNFLRHATNG